MVLKIAVCEILCFIRNYFNRGGWFVEGEFVFYPSESVPSSILGNCINGNVSLGGFPFMPGLYR